jgi:hypothetical protein
MKPRAMEDPRLAGYEEEWEEEEEEEDDDFGDVVEEYVVDEDWSDEETLMDLGESRDFRYTMEAGSIVKQEVERTLLEKVEAAVDIMPSGTMTVEEQDAKPVVAEEPSFTLKVVDSEVDMEDEQTWG